VAAELSQRLGLRLVLAHVADGIAPLDVDGEAVRALRPAPAAREPRAWSRAWRPSTASPAARSSVQPVGDPAALLAQIAAEEGADMIIVGSRARGRLRRGFDSTLARQLETSTSVPVVIAPPRTRRARKAASKLPDGR
jgi:nucleotide-binding universal stress UspA family protein